MITKIKRDKEEQSSFEIPTAQIFEDVDNENGSHQEQDDRYDTLAKQLADLQTRLSEAEKANMALLTQPQWKSQVTDTFVETKPESVALPDPALDPDGYDRAIGQRNQIRADNDRRRNEAAATKQREVSEKVEDLWTTFAERYPDMAEDKEKIDFVSTQVAKAAQRKGLDVERYMFLTQDKFLDDVAKKFIDVFGDPVENDDETEDYDDTPRRRRAAAPARPRRQPNRRNREEEDDNRTGGIFGGNESGGRPSRSRDIDEETGPSMIDDIQNLQRKTGFF